MWAKHESNSPCFPLASTVSERLANHKGVGLFQSGATGRAGRGGGRELEQLLHGKNRLFFKSSCTDETIFLTNQTLFSVVTTPAKSI